MKTTNYLTIDLEDWYQGLTSTSIKPDKWPEYQKRLHYGTQWLLNILSENNVKATFFVLGKSAEDYPELVKSISSEGHEISLHSYWHQRVDNMTSEIFRDDLKRNIEIIRTLLDVFPKGYRAPCFSAREQDEWFWEDLARCNLVYDSSIFPIKTTLYGNPRACRTKNIKKTTYGNIYVFPINTARIFNFNLPFSGGFYFRIIPYKIIKMIVDYKNTKGEPVIFYFHPWEFDPDHPKISKLISRERFSHYYGLKKTKNKFIRLINDFSFAPLGKYMDLD